MANRGVPAAAARRQTRGVLAGLAAICLTGAACYPTMGAVGIAHPNPAPPAGHELSLVGFAGGSLFTAGSGGGGLSYAARLGDGGLQIGGWAGGAGGHSRGYFYGGNLDFSIPLSPTVEPVAYRFNPIPLPPAAGDEAQSEDWDPNQGWGEDWPDWGAHRTTFHLLIGIRLEGVVEEVDHFCLFGDAHEGCPDPPPHTDWSYLAPQFSLGFAKDPRRGGVTGIFGSLRLEGGPHLDLDGDGSVTRGQVALTGAGGTRVLLSSSLDGQVFFAVQGTGRLLYFVPELKKGETPIGLSLAVVLSLEFDFGGRR